jgi:AmmeMemoRadiSam system protein B/AmmeMemoRadiSam system protein A
MGAAVLVAAAGLAVFVWSGRIVARPQLFPARAPEVTPHVVQLTKEVPPSARNVFVSPLAGRWYEADKDRLSAMIERYLANVQGEPPAHVQALVLPHAGYLYSGQTAAYGVKQLVGRRFSRVIVMGPSHRVPMENMASVPAITHYVTPLGEIPVDVAFVAALKEYPVFRSVSMADEHEHSVQIELPLLQHVLGPFLLAPIVVGQLDRETVSQMAKILLSLIDPDTLVVASSDFTHYGPNYGYVPFGEPVAENLERLDMKAFENIQKKDAAGLANYIEETGTTICGQHPIEILLTMLPAESQVHLIHYDTSGRVTGDFTNSVSYLSIAFTGSWSKGEPATKPAGSPPLSEEDKKKLLELARGTLCFFIEHRRVPQPEELGIEVTPAMKVIAGGFVTLTKGGELRGCIGEIEPRRPLYRVVMGHAVDAAFNDYRFSPVDLSEVPELHFEISALTPPQPVASYQDIVIGKHGIVLEKEGRSAPFLPQVAPRQGWDLQETLTHLSMKAGLPPDAWREGASLTVFEAVVFGEGSA